MPEEGLVLKAYGGYYFVQQDDGALRQCTLRGRLKARERVMVGDRVAFGVLSGGRGVIEKVYPRRSVLSRPPVANVDRVLVVMAFQDPAPALNLLDRILVHAEAAGTGAVVCVNKADLVGPEQIGQSWMQVYRDAGYPVLITSAVTGYGVAELREFLRGRITVLAGPSGAGKSSLINAICPGLALPTGEISRKLKRGRHVTRHVELLPLENGGWVADAPGFSVLHLENIARENLAGFFPEFRQARPCRFTDCLHYREPGCGVREAVTAGVVARFRYAHYLAFLREIVAQEEKRRRQ
jgi:ribosome biogenesis GTPase